MTIRIRALRTITDGGFNIPRLGFEAVPASYAWEWIGRGWAEEAAPATAPAAAPPDADGEA